MAINTDAQLKAAIHAFLIQGDVARGRRLCRLRKHLHETHGLTQVKAKVNLRSLRAMGFVAYSNPKKQWHVVYLPGREAEVLANWATSDHPKAFNHKINQQLKEWGCLPLEAVRSRYEKHLMYMNNNTPAKLRAILEKRGFLVINDMVASKSSLGGGQPAQPSGGRQLARTFLSRFFRRTLALGGKGRMRASSPWSRVDDERDPMYRYKVFHFIALTPKHLKRVMGLAGIATERDLNAFLQQSQCEGGSQAQEESPCTGGAVDHQEEEEGDEADEDSAEGFFDDGSSVDGDGGAEEEKEYGKNDGEETI